MDPVKTLTDTFKNRLDKFWMNQDMFYDCKAGLTRIGNKSIAVVEDVTQFTT